MPENKVRMSPESAIQVIKEAERRRLEKCAASIEDSLKFHRCKIIPVTTIVGGVVTQTIKIGVDDV